MVTELESDNGDALQAEHQFPLVEWNRTHREYPRHLSLHQHFEVQVARTPDALAIVFEEAQLTYRELDRRANQLAHTLQQLGVEPEVLVSVYMERSIEFVIALLAILKAGGAYVPLDPTYPPERIAFILKETQAPVLLTVERLASALSAYAGNVLCLDSDWTVIGRQDVGAPFTSPPFTRALPDNLAYIIYTSGSTGQPKGVQVSHASLLNLIHWHQETHGPGVGDRMSQMAALTFDACVWEIWTTLTSGACLHLPSRSARLSLSALQRWLIEQQITLCFLPTPLAEEFLALSWEESSRVRVLFVGGDKLRRIPTQVLPCILFDCYGPAESTVIAIAGEVPTGPRSASISSIGRPVANTSIYLLDASLRPVPPGEVGEVYIGGAGLARGYLHRPDLTAERFLPCPFGPEPGTRLYRTGDLARYHADGTVEYIGRVDYQVKLRGYRVELGEIEATLCTHQGIREAVIVAHEDRGEKRLVAYVLPEIEPPPTAEELRIFVQERLPDYMVPGAFVALETFPLSPHGKIDRAALPPPVWENMERSSVYSAPHTATEIMLAQVWAEVLPVKRIGREDRFFLLGGHSLLAIQALSRLRSRLQREIPLDTFFAASTLAELARYLDETGLAPGNGFEQAAPPLRARAREVSSTGEMFAPLSFTQQGLWLHDQLEPGNPSYNILTDLHLRGPLNAMALERSFHALVRRHEILRTTFSVRHDQPVQVAAQVLTIALPLIDLRGIMGGAAQFAEVQRQDRIEVAHAFHLERGPLLRVMLFRLSETEHILLVNMHHIISDGWSLSVLVQELGQLYAAFLSPERSDPTTSDDQGSPLLSALPIQYADYALWQREWMQAQQSSQTDQSALTRHMHYWKQRLAVAPALLELPADYPRPTVQTYRGASVSLLLDAPLVQGLRNVSQELTAGASSGGYTLFMTLLAVFYVLLFRLTSEEDIVVGTPFANRNRTELEGLIGFFVNTLVLRTDLSGDPPFLELLKRVQQRCLEAYAHQEVPFDRILEEVRPERHLSYTPLFQVFFNLLNMTNYPTHKLQWPELQAEVHWPQQVGAKFDLTLYAQEIEQGIRLEAFYNADLFTPARVQALLEEMRHLVAQVVAQPEKRLSHLSLVTPESRAVLPDPTEPLSHAWEGAVTDLFSIRAQDSPDRLAVRDGDGEWSYRELDERSNQLAHYLCTQGIQPQEAVAIYASRSASLVCAILGVLKAGAAYVILDPAYPVSRLITYIQLAHTRGFIHLEAAGPLPPALQEAVLTYIPHCQLTLSRRPSVHEHDVLQSYASVTTGRTIGPHDIACIAFTAGSTGQPKGVLQEHGSLTHFLPWLEQTFGLVEGDRYSLLSGLAHDPLQRDIFTPLCLGATLCVPSPDNIHTPGWLAAWMRRERITITNLTPAMLRVLIPSSSPAQPDQEIASLRYAFIVGDVLTRSDVNRLQRLAPTLTCVNFYGTTETQRAMGYCIVPRSEVGKEKIPLGRGWKDVQLLILPLVCRQGERNSGVLAGIGEVGEICVRSPHLARGYLDNDALTRERFIANPFTQEMDDRLYKTGDLGRYLPNGDVEYVGRNDQQVKLRGFRIEPGEIEMALRLHSVIREAVVIVREDIPGDKRLVAYVVPGLEHVDQPTLVGELRQFLATRLPVYMVPAAFVVLAAFPLLPTNKIDRAALPLPTSTLSEVRESRAPRNPREEILAGLWKQVLNVEQVGIDENFFELGGHSLLATQLLSRILDTFQMVVPLRTLFQAPTVASFAAVLEQQDKSESRRKQPALLPLVRGQGERIARSSRRNGGFPHALPEKDSFS